MKKFFKKYWWVILIVLIILGIFYWFQLRPAHIRAKCNSDLQKFYDEHLTFGERYRKVKPIISEELQQGGELFYKNCLREHGLEK